MGKADYFAKYFSFVACLSNIFGDAPSMFGFAILLRDEPLMSGTCGFYGDILLSSLWEVFVFCWIKKGRCLLVSNTKLLPLMSSA